VTQAQGREAITAKLAANLLTEAGSDRVIVCDMHSAQALGYFDIPVDHIYGQVQLTVFFLEKGTVNSLGRKKLPLKCE
jgi:ribose-phosphate pyrophosphokinase